MSIVQPNRNPGEIPHNVSSDESSIELDEESIVQAKTTVVNLDAVLPESEIHQSQSSYIRLEEAMIQTDDKTSLFHAADYAIKEEAQMLRRNTSNQMTKTNLVEIDDFKGFFK